MFAWHEQQRQGQQDLLPVLEGGFGSNVSAVAANSRCRGIGVGASEFRDAVILSAFWWSALKLHLIASYQSRYVYD
eukprot:3542428-Pyramimonas_sp.AAC.1